MLMPHLKIKKGDIHSNVLLPGDPGRVKKIIKFLKNVKKVSENRGYIIYNGNYNGKKVTVCNSNMGGPSLAIAVHELVLSGAKTIIRVGSCGALQEQISLGELIIPLQCVREEGTTDMYVNKDYTALPTKKVYNSLIKSCKQLGFNYYTGTTRSHDSFYTPNNASLEKFWNKVGLLGSDFETAPLFVIGKLLGINTGSILNNVYEYSSKKSIKAFSKELENEKLIKKGEKNSIIVALNTITKT